MKKLCTLNEPVYLEVVGFFYSNLHFKSPDEITFTFLNENRTLFVEELVEILSNDFHTFVKTRVCANDAYKILSEDSDFEIEYRVHVSHNQLPLKFKILQKFVIMCIGPNTASTNDISKYEAKLLWAIITGVKFSFPHTPSFFTFIGPKRRGLESCLMVV